MHTQSNGQQITLMLVGDENLSFYLNTETQEKMYLGEDGDYHEIAEDVMADMVQKAEVRRKSMNEARMERLQHYREAGILTSSTTAIDGPKKVGSFGTMTGKKKGLVILVNFTDKTFASGHTQSTFDDMFNKEGYNDNGHVGSVRDYFIDQSYGQFELNFDVVGPVTVSKTMSYYGATKGSNNDSYPATMVIEAVKLADNLGVNFADYDWDGDGYVDQVFVIYAGYGQASGGSTDTIWPHEWTLSSANYYGDGSGRQKIDGVYINTYACSCELFGGSGTTLTGMGTACHEFSHCLGYPDLYDTDYSGGLGMDYYDVMCGGSYNGPSGMGEVPCGYSAYERWMAGWVTPTELDSPITIKNMPALNSDPSAYIIYNQGNKNEYFLLENRQSDKWFSYYNNAQAGHGLFVTYIDYSSSVWSNNKPNDDASHQRVTWIPADGSQSSNYPADFFPGTKNVTSLTGDTHSDFVFYNNNSDGTKKVNHELTDIAESNGKVSFLFDGGLDDNTRFTVTFNAGTGTCTTKSWTQTSYNEGVTLPTAVAPDASWKFAGWASESVEESNEKPEINEAGELYKPKDNVTLYAVYQLGEKKDSIYYKLASSFYLDATYAIVSQNTAGSAVVLDAADLSSTAITTSVPGKAVTIKDVDGEMVFSTAIPSTADWTISGTSSSYGFLSELGYLYIYKGYALDDEGAAFLNSTYGLYCGWNTSSGVIYNQAQTSGSNFTASTVSSTSNFSTTNRVYLFEKNVATLSDATYNSNPALPSVPGDINRDGVIDISDVTALVDIILGDNSNEKWDYNAADVDSDGNYDETDVTILVNKILQK